MKDYKKYYFGVDVGGTSIKIGMFGQNDQEEKKFLTQFSITTTIFAKNVEKKLIEEIIESIEDFCEKKKISKNKIAGIGFAIPGPVVNNIVLKAVNINWTKKYDIVSAVRKKFGKNINVDVLNDANAAALGEYKFYLKSRYDSICFITLGTGIGAGIIINSKLIEGITGTAGELGHVRVDFSKKALKCNCGNIGCLETVASANGIANIYKRLFGSKSKIGTKEIVKRAKNGDEKAMTTLEVSFDYLSQCISTLINTYEPEVVLIGGGVSNGGKFIIDIIKKHLKEKVFMTKKLPILKIAKLKNKAGMYGVVANL